MPAQQPAPPFPLIERGPFKGLRGIGGSDAAVIIGVSPWKSAAQLWAERTGLMERRERSSTAMAWGSFLEKPILQAYTERTGRRHWRPKDAVVHESRSWMYGHLDAFAPGRIVEVKTARHNKGWGEEGTDAIPDHYYAQVQHYLAVTGRPIADVPVLFAGSDFRIYEVPASQEYIEALVEVEAHFMEAVKNQEEPGLDGSEATTDYLKQRYSRGDEGEAVATVEQEALVASLAVRQSSLEVEAKAVKELENQVKGAMGDHSRLWAGDFRVDWPTVTRKATTDWEKVASFYRTLLEGLDPQTVTDEAKWTGPVGDLLDEPVSLFTGKPTTYRRFGGITPVAREGNDA